MWTSNGNGEATGSVNVTQVTGAYGFEDNVNHVVVIHDPSGFKVACALLIHVVEMQGAVRAFEALEGEVILEGWLRTFKKAMAFWEAFMSMPVKAAPKAAAIFSSMVRTHSSTGNTRLWQEQKEITSVGAYFSAE